MGNGRRLKEHDPNTKIVAAEPLQGEDVQGLRSLDDGFIPPIIDISLLDRKILVSNRDGIIWTRKLFFEEGIFAGVSSGAIASVAVRIANELDEGNVVFLVADDGNKYMSAGLWTKSVDELEARRLHRLVVSPLPCGSARTSSTRCSRTRGRTSRTSAAASWPPRTASAVKVLPRDERRREPAALRDRPARAIRTTRRSRARLEIGAIYHSHTQERRPIRRRRTSTSPDWPGVVWLIVSLADPRRARTCGRSGSTGA